MWGKLNLPIFLFKGGLLTLIYIDSLIYLAKPCPSVPPYYLKVLLGGGMTCVTAMMVYGGRCGSFPYVFIIAGEVTTLEPVCGSTLLTMGSLSWGRPVHF